MLVRLNLYISTGGPICPEVDFEMNIGMYSSSSTRPEPYTREIVKDIHRISVN